MMKRCLLTSIAMFIAAVGLAQVPPDAAEATFRVADPDLEFKLWASEPLFANPTTIDVDHLGRVWVCEAVNYRQILRGKPVLRPEGDRILIVEDSGGSGKANKVTVFAQGPYLQAPIGIAVAKDPVGPGWKVYVCQSPDILLFEDKDGDGKADGPPTKLLTGFRGVDHDHGVHGITIGPDGRLYFSVGDQGVKDLQSSDGTGRKWSSNDTDCRAGTIWRCDMDGKNLELIAHNFRNEYKPCVDSFGNIFVSDNDDDGNEQTRICYVMPGGNYGYHPRGRGESHWHEEQPGVVPKVLRTYFGSPCGMCFYEGVLLPEKYRGQMLHCDAGPRHVRLYTPKAQGAGYALDRQDIVTSTDNWFRPSDVAVAPDGSVFVSDWYDPGVGGHGMGDTTRGRIYRLAPKGHRYSVPKVNLDSKDGLFAALASPANAVRHMAMAKIRGFAREEANKFLQSAIERSEFPATRARAISQAIHIATTEQLAGTAVVVYRRELDERFRLLAMRLIEAALHRRDSAELGKLLSSPGAVEVVTREPSAALRREALLWLPLLEPAQAKPLFTELAKLYDGKDRFYLAALGIALGQDQGRRDTLLADFDKQFPKWDDKIADLVWELRPPSVMPRLASLMDDVKIPSNQRARIVDILATSADSGATTLLKLLDGNANAEVRDRIVANFQLFMPNKWRDVSKTPEFVAVVDKLLTQPESAKHALALIASAERAESVSQIRTLMLGQAAPEIKKEALATLGAIRTIPSLTLLKDFLTADPELASVAVAAIGRHADNGRRNSPVGKPAFDQLESIVLNRGASYPDATRRAALLALANSRPGTQWLLEQRSQLTPELVAEAGRLVRNSPHPDLRNKALIAYPPPGKLDPSKLSLATLAKRNGNAQRGKELLAVSLKGELQCLKCHRVQSVGGEIGPDLSSIGTKASKENLYESILVPSKAIADQYINWTVVTKGGASIAGLLVAERPDSITIRDSNGSDRHITKAEIATREKNPVSIMPDNLVNTLTEEELVDLVEYLFSLKAPPSPAKTSPQ